MTLDYKALCFLIDATAFHAASLEGRGREEDDDEARNDARYLRVLEAELREALAALPDYGAS